MTQITPAWSLLTWDVVAGRVFLNHGSFGLAPRGLRLWRYALLDRLERDPVAFLTEALPQQLAQTRAALAVLVGASEERLALVPSTTYGLNELFQRLDLPSGSEVLAYDHAYNATLNLLRFAAEQRGWSLRLLPLPWPLEDSQQLVDQLQQAWRPATRLLLLDHITSCSALVLPVGQLAACVKSLGGLVIVDGAHAPGSIPLAIEALAVDAYVGNLHKWLCCPRGSAFLWVADPWRSSLRPLVISHGANTPLGSGQSRFQQEHDWIGTADPTPWLALPEALRLLGGDLTSLMRHNNGLAQQGRELLLEACSGAGLVSAQTKWPLHRCQAPMASVALPPVGQLDGPLLQRLLLAHGFQIPVIARTPHCIGVPQYLRVSCFAYNTLDQLQRLAAALPPLLREARCL